MGRSPLILASLAKAALPQVDFVTARDLTNNHSGAFDSVLLEDTQGQHYVVRMPNGQRASLDLETELQALRALTPSVRQSLPFQIPQLIGESRDAKGTRAVLFGYVYGESTAVSHLNGDSPLATAIGEALAAIHRLPVALVEAAGLPQYSPSESVKLAVSRLDRAAATGRVPASLLQRWESALEDVNLIANQGGGYERANTDGMALSLSMVPYGMSVPDGASETTSNQVNIDASALVLASRFSLRIIEVRSSLSLA